MSASGDAAMPAAQQPDAGRGPEPIRVLIADDHALFRRGLEMVLDEEDDIDLVGQASDGTEAVTVALKDKPAATEPGVALEQRLARFLTLRKRGACPPLF